MILRFKKCISLFSFLIISGSCLFAQQAGYQIRNYSPKEYGAFNQTWSAVQDRFGIIYFGTSGNVIAFNGQSWQKIPVVTGVATRSLAYDSSSNIIYVGAVGNFGYLKSSVNGQREYVSVSDKLPVSEKNFADVWKTFLWNGTVVFQSSEHIFLYKDGVVKTIEPKTSFALSFLVGKRLFVRERGVGLMEVNGDALQLMRGGEKFKDERLLEIIEGKNHELILLTGDQGFYRMDEQNESETFSKQSFTSDTFLLNSSVLGCIWLSDSVLSVSSRSGIALYSPELKLKEVLNMNDGLADQSIAGQLLDREKNLWLCTNNGITRISYGAPDRYYSKAAGFDGVFNSALRYHEDLYVATTSKIYRQVASPQSGKYLFHPVNMNKVEVWNMYIVGDDLLAASSDGLMLIKGDDVSFLTKTYVNSVAVLGTDELLLAEKDGMTYLRRNASGTWMKIRHFFFESQEFIDISDLLLVPGKPDEREAWTTTRYKEICRMRFSISDSSSDLRMYSTEKNNFICPFNLYPITIGDTTYFWSSYMALEYIPHLDTGDSVLCFGLAPHITDLLLSKLRYPVNSRLFSYLPGSRNILLPGPRKDGSIGLKGIQISGFTAEDIGSCLSEKNGDVWLCSTDALVHYDTRIHPDSHIPFSALITRVTIGDSIRFSGCGIDKYEDSEKIPYKDNRFVFAFAAPYFNHEQETNFSYQLQGYDTSWSAWNTKTDIQYNNLSEGNYTFRVKAKTIFDDESSIAEYHFTILAPWYRTGLAYITYILLFLGSIFVSVTLSARRLRKQKDKLERLVSERTAEVVEQNHKIEAQNFELESAYKGIQDSIHYAERIQHAILPVASEIHNSFPDSFVFFRPRDIVSGDFYWFVKREKQTWIACVDCTGHGVPGAFMSMIGNTLLNEIVLEKNIESPDKILNLLHVRIRQALRQDVGGETRDGMDISLCLIDEQKKKLFYAGANRAMWLMRKNELHLFDPDKFSIGGDQGSVEREFTLHQTDMVPGDCVYLSSDGYADQFGGEKGKKFMVKRFQDLVKQIHTLPMNEQHDFIEKAFLDWKGKLEQVDDVLVIGFRYN
jgi:serine phosphatase RsbU (regulator of sigma subunit)